MTNTAAVVVTQRDGQQGTKVEKFPNVQKDGQWLRAIARHGIGFLNPAGVVRGFHTA